MSDSFIPPTSSSDEAEMHDVPNVPPTAAADPPRIFGLDSEVMVCDALNTFFTTPHPTRAYDSAEIDSFTNILARLTQGVKNGSIPVAHRVPAPSPSVDELVAPELIAEHIEEWSRCSDAEFIRRARAFAEEQADAYLTRQEMRKERDVYSLMRELTISNKLRAEGDRGWRQGQAASSAASSSRMDDDDEPVLLRQAARRERSPSPPPLPAPASTPMAPLPQPYKIKKSAAFYALVAKCEAKAEVMQMRPIFDPPY